AAPVLRTAGRILRSPFTKEAGIELGAHAMGIGTPVRLARMAMRAGKALEPEASHASTALRSVDDVIDETMGSRPPGWLDRPVPEDAASAGATSKPIPLKYLQRGAKREGVIPT